MNVIYADVTLHENSFNFRFKAAWLTDKRVRIMNEIISGIRVIKMYAWENAFNRLISKLRRYLYMYKCMTCDVHMPLNWCFPNFKMYKCIL